MGSRETRRRKIVDRGADRLALITGQIRAINPNPEPDSDFFSPPPPRPPAALPIQSSPPSDEKTGGDSGSSSASASASPDPVSDDDDAGGVVQEEPEARIEAVKAPPESDVTNRGFQPSMPAEADSEPDERDSGAEKPVERRRRVNIRMTGTEITSAIAETEESRRFCTVAIAVAVVLSNWGLPLLGSFLMKGIISFRPFGMVLLTNVTLVVARIFLDDRRKSERPSRGPAKIPADGEIDWIEQAGKALEVTFVLQKAMDALLLDFSIYAAIVVCGLSV